MKLGLYGGSFDPIHAGHVEPIRAARQQLALERVVYLPTARPPHKPGRELTGALHRFAMVELALLDQPELVVSPFELTPGSTAYTVETVRHFRARHPEDELYLLIGADSLARLDTYYEWEEIIASVRLGVLVRPGWEHERVPSELSPRLAARLASADPVWIDNPPVEASSTRLRRILAAGEPPPAGWLDPRVLQYVQKYSLYR